MFGFILRKIIGTQNERELRKLRPLVEKINSLEPEISKLTDAELREMTDKFRKRLEKETLEDILPEAFAVVREIAKRKVNMRHFDVQLMGGIVLHQGKIAEMATGEGKTLVATLSAYLNALKGESVHIVTVNDYLAKRDREWMGPIYESLGLSVGVIVHGQSQKEKKEAYLCDITYGTNNEFGFDYLRDNMAMREEDVVQRKLHYAIVDEVDSILIDEARTPLIISGPAEESPEKYFKAHQVALKLKGRKISEKDEIDAKFKGVNLEEGYDYLSYEKAQNIVLTEQGIKKCEELLGVENLYADIENEWEHLLKQALRATEFFHRDVDYVIKGGEIIIVDEFTGRLMPGRRWSDGLHQAIEAKEKVKIKEENQTLATISFQNYFRMYEKLAGMTGTAATEAGEFHQIYKLDVVVVPTNKPLRRTNHPDCIYKTQREKFNAVVEEIEELYKLGRPVLVGTISIEKSELISKMLKSKGIPHNVLNAKYHEKEAEIIAQAGRYKAVTIATNMAGRGTDILLGGNPEFLAKSILKQRGIDIREISKEDWEKVLNEVRPVVEEEHKKVVELGGLHVLGTERHEARRIDNQLRGRAGRQGDPGSSRFYLALEDDLLRLFGSERIVHIMDRLGIQEGEKIEHPLVSKAIETAQKRVENYNFEIRKHLLEYDDVMNKQREAIYSERQSVLFSQDLKEHILEVLRETIEINLETFMPKDFYPDDYDWEGISKWLWSSFHVYLKGDDIKNVALNGKQLSKKDWEEIFEKVSDYIFKTLKAFYEKKEEEIGRDEMRFMEKIVFLHIIDSKWKQHLYAMDYLREGIGLRAYGQRDPLVEYKHEGYEMFTEMVDRIKFDVLEFLFKAYPRARRPVSGVMERAAKDFKHEEMEQFQSARRIPSREEARIPSPKTPPQVGGKTAPYRRPGKKVGRNDPCPCGSGKKYKKCCYPKYG
jgi:preprotein translocase subunit SecA